MKILILLRLYLIIFSSIEKSFSLSNMYAVGQAFNFRHLSPESRYHYRKFEKSVVRLKRLKNQKTFLLGCRSEQVIPKSFEPKIMMDFQPFHPAKKLILEDRISNCKEQIESAAFNSRQCCANLRYFFSPSQICTIKNIAHNRARNIGNRHASNLERKLRTLCKNSVWNKLSLSDNVLNLSSRNLSSDESTLLGLGFSFNLQPSNRDIISTISSFENFIFKHGKDRDFLRGIISPFLLSIKQDSPFLPRRLWKSLQALKQDKSITILPADKGGKVVILDTSTYHQKVMELLSDVETYEPLVRDPLNNINKLIRSKLQAISNRCPDPQVIRQFLKPNCSLSYFYGLPKLHKHNIPLRPIISSTGTASRGLAGWLARSLSPYLGRFSSAHLINSLDFKEKLKIFSRHHSLNGYRMLSLDVTALFTNVPLEDVLDFLREKIENNSVAPPVPLEEFLELIRLCVDNNVFEFNGQYFRQKFGVAMGSPLSPVLAGLYMEHFETELLPGLQSQPAMWLRYVDDVFALWPEGQDFDVFFDQLNRLSPTIKFTVEWEQESELPFLDVKVSRFNSGFNFGIYRKPTHSHQYLHFFSWQPNHVKRSTLFSLFLRAYRICDSSHLQSEIDYLFSRFIKIGYPVYFIQKVLSDVRKKYYNHNNNSVSQDDHSRKPVISLPYNEFSNKYIKPLFSAQNSRVVNSSNNTLRKNLFRPKQSKPPCHPGSGVYIIPCGECSRCYVGETGRDFSVRLKEHQSYVRNGNDNSAVFNHVNSKNHSINWSGSKIVYPSNNKSDRLAVESTLIKFLPNFNNSAGANIIDPLSTSIVLSSNSSILRKVPPNLLP